MKTLGVSDDQLRRPVRSAGRLRDASSAVVSTGSLLHFLARSRCAQFLQSSAISRSSKFQQIVPSSARPRSQLRLTPVAVRPAFPPQRFLAAQAFVERYGMQLVHDPVRVCTMRCRCHSSCRRSRFSAARYPDLRKAILHHQSQNQLRILTIRLLLAYPPGCESRPVSDPQLNPLAPQQSLEPARRARWLPCPPAPSGFRCRQHPVECFGLLTMRQPFFLNSPVSVSTRSNLLEARDGNLPYNDHRSAPFSPSLLVGISTTNFTRASEPTLLWNHFTHNHREGCRWR